ncbi:MAG: hypothetical protein KGQ66_00215 [Acidobacteriota bacterium]|nr:hypothetical protein [Acidobacteriota bacterium]
MQKLHDDPRIGLVAVGFSPADRLSAIARHHGWRGEVLSDPERRLYRRLGVGRARWWRVYNPGTLAVYARAVIGRRRLHRAEEDTRQLGADAVMVQATVRTLWRPASPDDRPPAAEVMAAAAEAVRRRAPDGG